MKRLVLAVAAVSVLAGATACTAQPEPAITSAADNADSRFLAQLDAADIPSPGIQHIDVAHSVCDALDAGATPGQVILASLESSPLDATQTGTIIGAGVGTYCPEYVGDFAALGGDPS